MAIYRREEKRHSLEIKVPGTLGRGGSILESITPIEVTCELNRALSLVMTMFMTECTEPLSRKGYLDSNFPKYATLLERRPLEAPRKAVAPQRKEPLLVHV